MKGSLDLLEADADRPEKDRRIFERMRRVVNDMETLLETLLTLAREEDVFADDESTSVNQVIAEEIELLTEFAEAQGNRIEFVEEVEAVCRAKPRVLAIIVSNLLRNALTYTEHGVVTVHLTAEQLVIRDTGIGMSEADMENAFTAFFRGDTAARTTRGQGLGLALVRRLAQQLNWRVDMDSQLGEGTEFRVSYQ